MRLIKTAEERLIHPFRTVLGARSFAALVPGAAWVGLVCGLPALLIGIGFDFSIRYSPEDGAALLHQSSQEVLRSVREAVRGAYIHTIFEWMTFLSAIFFCVLAFARFRLQRDRALPILGLSLVIAGLLTVSGGLVDHGLVAGDAQAAALLPAAWAMTRSIAAALLVFGVSLVVWTRGKERFALSCGLVVLMGLALAGLAHGLTSRLADADALARDSGLIAWIAQPL